MALRLVTRGSALALAQSQRIAGRIGELGVKVDLVVRTTAGDAITDRPFKSMEGKGFFTKELEQALLDGDAELAVHSLKDLPTELPAGLAVSSVPERADPADVLLVRRESLDTRFALPVKPGARVGTTSSRRRAQWFARRPDTTLLDLRGNVPTRVDKLRQGNYDAIVIAAAGIDRLQLDTGDLASIRLDPTVFVCAPGQGALAIEIRESKQELDALLRRLDNGDARAATEAERAVLAGLGGGCSRPVGAFARRRGSNFLLDAVLGPEIEGSAPLRRARVAGDSWTAAASEALARLRDKVSEIPPSLTGKTILLTQQSGRADLLTRELEERGATVWTMPLIETHAIDNAAPRVWVEWALADYVALTSVSAVEALFAPGARPGEIASATDPRRDSSPSSAQSQRICAVGEATARALEERDISVALRGEGTGAATLAAAIVADAQARGLRKARVLFPCAANARPELVNSLRAAGLDPVAIPVYSTSPVAPGLLAPFLSARVDSVVFFSPSAVRAFARTRPVESRQWLAIGETTRRALEDGGFHSVRSARSAAVSHVLDLLH